jgi:hypothetical protein
MTDKEQQIRLEVLPQLESLANHLWDNQRVVEGRKMDKIVDKLAQILNSDNPEETK